MSSDNPLFDIKTGEARIRRICIDCADIRCCCRHDDENDENEAEDDEVEDGNEGGCIDRVRTLRLRNALQGANFEDIFVNAVFEPSNPPGPLNLVGDR